MTQEPPAPTARTTVNSAAQIPVHSKKPRKSHWKSDWKSQNLQDEDNWMDRNEQNLTCLKPSQELKKIKIPQAGASLTDPVDSEEVRTTPSTMRKGTTRSQDDVLFDSVCVCRGFANYPVTKFGSECFAQAAIRPRIWPRCGLQGDLNKSSVQLSSAVSPALEGVNHHPERQLVRKKRMSILNKSEHI